MGNSTPIDIILQHDEPLLYFSHSGVLCLPAAVLPSALLPILHEQFRLLPGPAGGEGLAVLQGDQPR